MSNLEVSVRDHIAVVTINNPAKHNALTLDMWQAFPSTFERLGAEPGVRVIIVNGEGRHFCSGSDISSLDLLDDGALPVAAELAIAHCPKPVIAAINGVCLGGGCELACACDLRVCGDESRFSVPPANLGVIYPLPATRRLVSLIGPAATKYLMYTGEPITATRALHIGLVDEVVASDVVFDRALHLAERIASRSQLTLQATKQIVDTINDDPGGLDALAAQWIARAADSDDLAEGKAAFLERRPPNFTWQA